MGNGFRPVLDDISIRAPARGATHQNFYFLFDNTISIRAPARGATFSSSLDSYQIEDFNPRSREGSDYQGTGYYAALSNFNPRSREGSDVIYSPYLFNKEVFQSALPRGERRRQAYTKTQLCGISIRAPARGATYPRSMKGGSVIFQSALPRGERLARAITVLLLYLFQSALPRGERRHCPPRLFHSFNFNPRSREGSDSDPGGTDPGGGDISIRAPARGATDGVLDTFIAPCISIRAPARGATLRKR